MNKMELVFNMFKEECIGARKFRSIAKTKYKLDDKDITNIYTRINNYQINKYGERLPKGNEVILLTANECQKRARQMCTYKNQRINRGNKAYEEKI